MLIYLMIKGKKSQQQLYSYLLLLLLLLYYQANISRIDTTSDIFKPE